jgi:leader peptidase (prepilin peptidase) / N-methyltransferase
MGSTNFSLIITAAACVLGMIVGSFFDFSIKSIISGKKRHSKKYKCPQCMTPIRSIDNIPLFSTLLKNGRCSTCSWPIPLRIPWVELLFGGAFGLIAFLIGS